MKRGRVDPIVRAPNADPVFLPEPPKKLVFGVTRLCYVCKGKGKKGRNLCGLCTGNGVIDESDGGDGPGQGVAP